MRHDRKVDIQSKEDEDVSPDTGVLSSRVDAKCLESAEDDEDGGPAVVEREGEVDEDLVGGARRVVVLLDDVVDVRHRGGDEEREDEGCAG